MYTIFKNESSIIFSDSAENLAGEQVLKWSESNRDRVVSSLEINEGKSFVILGEDKHAMFHDFKRSFKIVEAAGGVVRNDSGQILLIFRHDTWDLPKGKLDEREEPSLGALREVEEECGFTSLALGDFLQHTYHIYEEKGSHILKVTHWFSMRSNQTNLRPQLEEGITALSWMSKEDLGLALENSYPNIRLLISNLLDR